jgi:mRNA interferase RelE/StbE
VSSYLVRLEKKASKQIEKLPPAVAKRVITALEDVSQNPRGLASKKLEARDGYRYRVGDYRILYLIDDYHHEVVVYKVMHRREVYRGLV